MTVAGSSELSDWLVDDRHLVVPLLPEPLIRRPTLPRLESDYQTVGMDTLKRKVQT